MLNKLFIMLSLSLIILFSLHINSIISSNISFIIEVVLFQLLYESKLIISLK